MTLNRHFKSLSLALGVVIALGGCANKPREVKADIPLVTANSQQPNGEIIPQQYWQALGDPLAVTLIHPSLSVELGPLYFSALGQQCRTLVIADKYISNTRIACAIDVPDEAPSPKWYLSNSVVQGAVELTL